MALALRTKGRVGSPTPAETEQYSRLFDTDVRHELRYERCITYMLEQIDIIYAFGGWVSIHKPLLESSRNVCWKDGRKVQNRVRPVSAC